MRLKSIDGSLAVHNGNNDILNSPKRINTVQNSNITLNNYNNSTAARSYNTTSSTNYSTSSTTTSYISEYTSTVNSITNAEDILQTGDLNVLNNVAQDKVQWCNLSLEAKERELANNNANNKKNRNINITTLAASVGRRRQTRHQTTASSICSIESSPDDSLLEYAEAQQSCSSAETSPQDEDRAFDISDSESSDDGNLSNRGTLQRRGIVNPNYPGFQHLAHTLDFKASSDTDFTDDDLECDAVAAKLEAEANNNNNIEDTDYIKIDSVNRLDSVENIQKVFYEKEVFNLEEESDINQISESSSGNANTSDEDTEVHVNLNIKTAQQQETHDDIVGDFRKEVEAELGKLTLPDVGEKALPKIEVAEVQELEQAVEKLQVIKDISPTGIKYNIEPNFEEAFNKLSPTKQIPLHQVLQDTEIVQNTATMPMLEERSPVKAIDDVIKIKIQDAFLSNAKENITMATVDSNLYLNNETKMEVDNFRPQDGKLDEIEFQIKKIKTDFPKPGVDNFSKEQITKEYKEKDDDSAVPRKKEKVDVYVKKRRDYNQQFGSLITFPRKDNGLKNRDPMNRRSVPMAREKKRSNPEALGGFDVYNIETAMPKIDLEAIECHLRAAREEEQRRRTDREEIRRRLAMGSEDDYYSDRPGRKPSLQARLQSGMNLQICFMNETLSDTDSPSSDSECPMTNPKQPKTVPKNPPYYQQQEKATRPATLSIGQPMKIDEPPTEMDFFTKQARLQTEARMALAQAKEMARMQMEIEKQRQKKSPITEMIRNSLEKVGIPFPEEKRRLSRQILTEMNVAQLQVIVNDLHTQIETLNESLVKFLMDRDDLHMEQDSMLVDIEDLTRYLGAKEQVLKEQNVAQTKHNNNATPPSPAPSSPLSALNSSVKPHLHRITSLVKK